MQIVTGFPKSLMPHIGAQIWQELPKIPAFFHPACQSPCGKVMPENIRSAITLRDYGVSGHFPALMEKGADALCPMLVPVPVREKYFRTGIHPPRDAVIIAAHLHDSVIYGYAPVLMPFGIRDIYGVMVKIKILPPEMPDLLRPHPGRILEAEERGCRLFIVGVCGVRGKPFTSLKKTPAFFCAHDIWELPFLIAEIIFRKHTGILA